MFNIDATLEMMPTLCILVLVTILAVLELRHFHAVRYRGTAPGAFTPHGNGYEYYVDSATTVYILECGNCWKIYHVCGREPSLPLRQDRYGSYFTLNCGSAAEAEVLVERTYR